jgi:hypothetical protein
MISNSTLPFCIPLTTDSYLQVQCQIFIKEKVLLDAPQLLMSTLKHSENKCYCIIHILMSAILCILYNAINRHSILCIKITYNIIPVLTLLSNCTELNSFVSVLCSVLFSSWALCYCFCCLVTDTLADFVTGHLVVSWTQTVRIISSVRKIILNAWHQFGYYFVPLKKHEHPRSLFSLPTSSLDCYTGSCVSPHDIYKVCLKK